MTETQQTIASPRTLGVDSEKLAPFNFPKKSLGNKYVYAVISPRARGLSVGVNLNPSRHCNFDCIYCEVRRDEPSRESRLDVSVMITELERTLGLVNSGAIRQRPCYQSAPPELLELRHVSLSGDGEPTLCPNFGEAVEAVVHLRARGRFPFFKLVLLTNASGYFEAPLLQPGTYRIVVEMAGFKSIARDGVARALPIIRAGRRPGRVPRGRG